MRPPVCPDRIIDRLEVDINEPPSKPDQRRRWAQLLIWRLRVTELAAKTVMQGRPEQEWRDALLAAADTLRREGKVG